MIGSVPERFVAHVHDERLFPEAGTALVGVSGGADSLALLYLMFDAADELRLRLVVGHVDHGISPVSAEWAAQVEALGDALGVPVAASRLSLGGGASETVARRERYRALRRIQREHDARYLVVAHHADDQIETVLQRLLRGSGVAGLAGMAPVGRDGLVRPLLPFRRAELADWLSARTPDAIPVADPANRDARHDRVWVRTQLLSLLHERYGSAVDAQLLGLAAQARAERDAWRAVLRELRGLDPQPVPGGIEVARGVLLGYDKMLCAALLRASAREAGCRIGMERAARLARFVRRAESGHAFELGDGWVGEVVFDRVRIHRPEVEAGTHRQDTAWGGAEPGAVTWGRWSIEWRAEPAGQVTRRALTTWALPGDGLVRGWQPGDRLRPHGGRGSRKVRRLLMEARVPRRERSGYPLIVRGGDILWIPGVCRSEASLPRPGQPSVRLDARRNRDP